MSWGVALRNAVGLGLGGIPSLLNAPPYARLAFNFLSGELDPRITFSRTTNATLIGSDGALQYAPHNLLTYSEQIDNAAWTKAQSTIAANSIASPDGTITADKVVEDTAATVSHYTQSPIITTSANIAYAGSVYVKAAERRYIAVTVTGGGGPDRGAFFDGLTGAYTGGFAGGLPYTVTDVGNGWFRYALTDTPTAASAYALRVYVCDAANNILYTGNGTSGIYAWGAQLNVGALQPYYQTVASAYYGPRFDYDPVTLTPKGLLIEEQRTNSLRNNTMQGAVAGTPGTLPTYWDITTSTINGITRTVVGTGVESGIAYVDIKYSGTAIGAGNVSITSEYSNQVAAAQNQVWTFSCYARLVAGSFANTTNRVLYLNSYTAGGGFDANSGPAVTNYPANGPSSASLISQRYSYTGTIGSPTAAFVNAGFYFTYNAGAVIDFTLRIGLPQLELGAFATSVIPTTTTALTRAADIPSIIGANFSNWYNPVEGTMFVEFSHFRPGGFPAIASISNGLLTDRINLLASTTVQFRASVIAANVTQAELATGTYTINSVGKMALAVRANDFALAASNGAIQTDTSGTMPTVNRLEFGFQSGGLDVINGHIRSFKYFPTRLSDSALQLLTR